MDIAIASEISRLNRAPNLPVGERLVRLARIEHTAWVRLVDAYDELARVQLSDAGRLRRRRQDVDMIRDYWERALDDLDRASGRPAGGA